MALAVGIFSVDSFKLGFEVCTTLAHYLVFALLLPRVGGLEASWSSKSLTFLIWVGGRFCKIMRVSKTALHLLIPSPCVSKDAFHHLPSLKFTATTSRSRWQAERVRVWAYVTSTTRVLVQFRGTATVGADFDRCAGRGERLGQRLMRGDLRARPIYRFYCRF